MSANQLGRIDDGARGAPITRRRPTLACLRCRTRRVKCDRASPVCGNCAKGGYACVQASNSSTSIASPSPAAGFKRDPVDRDRLSKLEEEVERLSREVNSQSPSQFPSNASHGDCETPSERELQGMVVSMPQSRYFSPYSWAAVSEELADIQNVLGAGGSGVGEFSPVSANPDSYMQLPFSGQAHAALAHVNEELSSTLIQLFIQRVDPLIRLIHLPSFFSQLQSYKASLQSSTTQYPTNVPENYFSAADSTAYTAQNPSASLQRQSKSGFQAFETLLCSVYFAAITTVVADPNPPYFGKDVDIDTLSAMFKREVTIQLALLDDVDLARNGTLEMLQAIVLMLAVQPSCSHPRTQWIRLGSATRMAQAMGLHRDPAQYGLRPIETETRRRLWAQICMLDVQFAEELGCEPTVMIGSYDTCLPLSISDDELTQLEMRSQSSGRDPSERSTSSQPNLTEPHQNYSPYSPMTFSLIPFEASRVTGKLFLSRYQPKDSIVGKGASISRSNSRRMRDFSFTNCSLADKSFLVDLLEERFHQVYKVQSFDPADPFQSFVARSAELHVAKARFVIELLRWKETVRTMDTVERERETKRLFQEAVSIATKSIKMIYDPRLSEWLWYMKQFREVYTCSFVLFNLACGRSLDPADVQAAWQTIDQLFPPAADNSGSTHRSPLGRLLALARSRRGQQHTGAWQETAPPQVSSAPISQHPPLVHPYPTRMQPTTSEAYIPAQAALSGTMFEDMDFMMQNPYWPENMNTGQFPNDSLDPWV